MDRSALANIIKEPSPLVRTGIVFKNTEDEKVFCGVLSTYRQEFGAENLIIFLPRGTASSVSKDMVYEPMVVRYWKKNLYSIRVRDMSAGYDFEPND